MGAFSLVNPSYICFPQEYEAYLQAEREHAENVAVRMNPATFRVEYYNVLTGEIVSSHI